MIPEFFKDREIFLTGGSGVVGKAVIEKLLRSCNVHKIYILLRSKPKVSIEKRLEDIKKEKIFRRLHAEKPQEFDEKVVAIPGDVELPMLGITDEYLKLMENVSIVYHSAATIRFNEPIKKAIRINVGGTLEALKFAEKLEHLVTFIYISTFFSNPYLEFVDTKIYESPLNWKLCLDLSRREDIDEETINIITSKLIVGFPNTYCFTKNLTESMVNDHRHKLPIAVYRPSIVIQSMEDPEYGFPTTLVGAMALFALPGAGIFKVIHCSKDICLDMAPLDFTTKSLLYYTMKTFAFYSTPAEGRPKEMPVFIVSSYKHFNVTLRQYCDMIEKFNIWHQKPLEKSLLLPGVNYTDNVVWYHILFYIQHLIPSLLVDFLFKVSGNQPVFMKIQRKLYLTMEVVKPFMFNNYRSNGITYAKEMLDQLHGTDFNMDALKWTPKYTRNVAVVLELAANCRDVLFNEDPSTIPRAKIVLKIKIFLYRLIQLYLAYKIYNRFVEPFIANWNTRENMENLNVVAN
uniref:Fatty acyl-CoA reductase n=1 Tax=Stomoxys calcitrans TaxID=35570 RepID=A0A1I8PFS4_STOCA